MGVKRFNEGSIPRQPSFKRWWWSESLSNGYLNTKVDTHFTIQERVQRAGYNVKRHGPFLGHMHTERSHYTVIHMEGSYRC